MSLDAMSKGKHHQNRKMVPVGFKLLRFKFPVCMTGNLNLSSLKPTSEPNLF